MQINGKIWGTTEPLLTNGTLELHRIHFEAGSECSMHKHERKFNAFYVIDGTLEIHVEKNDYELTDVTRLAAGSLCVVPPGEYHKFVGIHRGSALEIYWSELDPKDIVRKNVGSNSNVD